MASVARSTPRSSRRAAAAWVVGSTVPDSAEPKSARQRAARGESEPRLRRRPRARRPPRRAGSVRKILCAAEELERPDRREARREEAPQARGVARRDTRDDDLAPRDLLQSCGGEGTALTPAAAPRLELVAELGQAGDTTRHDQHGFPCLVREAEHLQLVPGPACV